MSITIHGEVNQPVCWRSELAESHAAFGEDACRLIIHEVALIVNNFADAYLGDFDAAGQAWAGVAIKDGCLADAVSTGFEEGVLFGVKAEAGGESDAALGCVVTARAYSKSAFGRFRRGILVLLTTTFIAVGHAPWRTIVPRADNSLLLDDNAPNPPLHTIASQSCKVRELHEVLIPARSQPCFVCEVQRPNSLPQRGDGCSRIQQLELGSLEEGTQAGALSEEVVIVAQDELLKCGRGQIVNSTAVLEALPSYADGCVNADEEEEGPSKQCVDHLVVPYVGRYPAFSPA